MKRSIIVFFVLLSSALLSQNRDVEKGEKLYKLNCKVCHDLDKKILGPPLRNIEERRENDWLHKWIKDNSKLRASGDKLALKVYEDGGKIPMQSFPNLSKEDIENILKYTSNAVAKKEEKQEIKKVITEEKSELQNINRDLILVLIASIIIAILCIILLFKSKQVLRIATDKKELNFREEINLFFKKIIFILKNRYVLPVILFIVIVGGLYILWTFTLNLGIDKGYQPVQPIAFSHKIHAGDNKIDCQYCHSASRDSKTAGVPSANVCMNCHRLVQEGTLTGTKEIAKIYDAVGFDVDKGEYIKDYEHKPIEWIKVHNLQDFVFFSHKQHVEVGGLECKECHGDVEKMDEVYQHSDLTMGWCIECHKEKEVDKGNPYYEKIHQQLQNKLGVEKLTVEMIGGLECGKCHY